MNATMSDTAAGAAVQAAATSLHLPTVRAQADELAEAAARDGTTHRGYLAELLAAEVDERAERRRIRRTREARFPRHKLLEDFDTSHSPVDPATIATLAAGDFIDASRPAVLLGDSGTGKTHLLIGAGMAACQAGRSVRYVTAAGLVNELVEAQDAHQLSKIVGRYGRYELLLVDLCRPWDYADTSVGEAAEGAVRHHVAGIWPGSGARRSA
jgi:DNA replication protein DnaC